MTKLVLYIVNANCQSLYISLIMKKRLLAFIFCICTLNLFAQIANTPSDYLLCSSDPGVEIAVFDLSAKTSEILEGLDAENFTISYYLSLQDADNMINPLPQFFTNFTNPQTIFVSVMENSTGNLDITSFDLIVSETPFLASTLFLFVRAVLPR